WFNGTPGFGRGERKELSETSEDVSSLRWLYSGAEIEPVLQIGDVKGVGEGWCGVAVEGGYLPGFLDYLVSPGGEVEQRVRAGQVCGQVWPPFSQGNARRARTCAIEGKDSPLAALSNRRLSRPHRPHLLRIVLPVIFPGKFHRGEHLLAVVGPDDVAQLRCGFTIG